jgi:ketosteroid isomerase-like protein
MTDVEMLADLVASLAEGIHQAVTGLSALELAWRPDAEGNSIGVTVWHCSRGLDVLKVRFLECKPAEAEQWHTQGWAEKTGYDPCGIGTGGLGILSGYTQEEVTAIPLLSAEELLAYLDQVSEALRRHLLSLPQGALSQPTMFAGENLTAYQLIKSIVLGCIGHLGEIQALKALQIRARQRTPERLKEEPRSQQKLETVKRLFDGVRRRDPASILEAYHPEAVVHEAPSMPYGGDYHGHEGAMQHVNGYYQTWDAFRPQDSQEHPHLFLETTADYVVVLWREEALAPKSGKRIDLPALGMYKVRDGKIIESRMFQDSATIGDFLKDAQQQAL